MKHYRVRTETAVIGSNLPCVVCGDRSSELAIVPIGLPPVAGLHKRCIDKLHRKRGGEEQTSDGAAESPVAPTTLPAGGSEDAGFTKPPVGEYTCPKCGEVMLDESKSQHWMTCTVEAKQRATFVRRAIAEKILPEGLPQEEAWQRLQFAAPKGWFKLGGQPHENIGELARNLKERGVDVNLVDLAAWPVEHRQQAQDWMTLGGDRPTFFPSACMACNRGVPNDKENGYKHTGEGPECRTLNEATRGTSSKAATFCAGCGVEVDKSKPWPVSDGKDYCSPECLEKKASWAEAGRVCAREGCGKTVEERNSTRVGDELFCSAACGLPKGLAAVKPSAAERTLPLMTEKPKFDDQW